MATVMEKDVTNLAKINKGSQGGRGYRYSRNIKVLMLVNILSTNKARILQDLHRSRRRRRRRGGAGHIVL